ncbi:hypothetical protein F5878DRAFT_640973 [Lentinula raphanica]|uniref:Uncharacterized protein n=1 Tax=Lentinula raphanica TaxID=153919 RepID=A0AA38UFB6_9AGAR|nr:hypothetical protein F5878DRAFT_640973 [Lentinula raphanica]
MIRFTSSTSSHSSKDLGCGWSVPSTVQSLFCRLTRFLEAADIHRPLIEFGYSNPIFQTHVDDSEITLNRRTKSHPPNQPRTMTSTSSTRRRQIYSDHDQPNFFIALCLLVLLGSRPQTLQAQLDSDDPKTWLDFRDSLVRRWGTLGITSGLVLSAATSMVFSDRISGAAMVAALASLCATIVSITFGTALAFLFTDAPVRDFKALATRPTHMLFLLSIPNMFAMGAMGALYISITIFAFTFDDGVATIFAKVGTILGALVMAALFAYASWLVQGLGKHTEHADELEEANWKEVRNVM